MRKYVVAISIDKVQSFLYDVLRASEQEKQTNSGTLKDIIGSSLFISDQFYRDIGLEGDKNFAPYIEAQLLKCSGKCIFTTHLSEEGIVRMLDELFEKYYKSSNGQLLLRYVYFEQHSDIENPELSAIHESNKRLKHSACLNSIIERNRELLFTFQPSEEQRQAAQLQEFRENSYPTFTRTINELYDQAEADNENRFRVVLIKADLDGMGDLFKGLQSYDAYREISQLLSEHISLEALHLAASGFKKKDASFRLYPLYIAGDDLFFAVPASKLIDGVHLCRHILGGINRKIADLNDRMPLGLQDLSMSVGIDFTFNREPIRYYYERVQHQLELAKKAQLTQDNGRPFPFSCINICINGVVIYDYALPSENKVQSKASSSSFDETIFKRKHAKKLRWRHLTSNVKQLQYAMEKGFAAHHFYYGLLKKLKDPVIAGSTVKYSNAVLYHMIPQNLNMSKELREAELVVLEMTLKQMLIPIPEKIPENKGNSRKETNRGKVRGPEKKLNFESAYRQRLEGYVGLLLLFSDPRFEIVNKGFKPPIIDDQAVKRIRGTLFTKSMNYLFTHNLNPENERALRDIFVKDDTYIPSQQFLYKFKGGNVKKPGVHIYRTLRLSNSLLHRVKQGLTIQQVSRMLAATNPQEIAEIEQRAEENKGANKAPPGLYFDEIRFQRLASSSKHWNTDYMDSLLIFYQLKDRSIQYRTLFPKKLGGKRK